MEKVFSWFTGDEAFSDKSFPIKCFALIYLAIIPTVWQAGRVSGRQSGEPPAPPAPAHQERFSADWVSPGGADLRPPAPHTEGHRGQSQAGDGQTQAGEWEDLSDKDEENWSAHRGFAEKTL